MSTKFRLFIEESQELLAELESAFLELETDPRDMDGVHRVFRALHTIKGSAAMLGLEDVRELTNDLETLFDLVRAEKMMCSPALLSLSFNYKDLLIEYLADPEKGLPADRAEPLRSELRALMENPTQESASTRKHDPGQTDPLHAHPRHFFLRYQPQKEGLDQVDPMDFLGQLQQLGECTIHASARELPLLEHLQPLRCFIQWEVVLLTTSDLDSIQDLFLFLDNPEDVAELREIDAEQAANILAGFTAEEAGLRCTVASPDQQPSCPAPQDQPAPKSTSAPVEQSATSTGQSAPAKAEPSVPAPKSSAAAPAAQQKNAAKTPGGAKSDEIASIRVSADKLDDMVDLVGQLVIVQARLKQIESELHNPILSTVSEEIERLSSDLRERTLSLRMLPIGSTFNRFRRLVRDLSSELGKEIELKTFGAETELDKTVIEKLSDPLVHILRNSIDHGVESADAREANGKSRKGTITLSAMQSAGQVQIVIEDDGGGIDPDKIFAKAVERGLAKAEARPSDRDVLQFIFQPGFSTAEKVTSVSGRGVGMDVVRRSLESLKGSVEIDSRLGEGTAITIGLPLTLAIIEGLLVLVGSEYYVIPLSDVLECVEIQRGDSERDRLAKAFDVRGQLLPCMVLRNWYHLTSKAPEIEQVVVVQAGSRRVGLVVDSIVGQLQTVIKGLGRVFTGMKGLSGATIMGNGAMALILDVVSMVHELEAHERTHE